MRCDVTKEEEVLEMFEKIKAQTGGVDVCVNNAGLSHDAPLLAGATSDWREMIEVFLYLLQAKVGSKYQV